MKKWVAVLSILMLFPLFQGVALAAEGEEAKDPKVAKADYKRAKIDSNERDTLKRLFAKDAKAKRLFDRAVGYAVFDNTKVSLGLTGGGGAGVAVDKASGKRTYMKMGTAGLNLGLGAQVYQLVFMFEDAETLKNFIETGWEADASANAVAGTASHLFEDHARRLQPFVLGPDARRSQNGRTHRQYRNCSQRVHTFHLSWRRRGSRGVTTTPCCRL